MSATSAAATAPFRPLFPEDLDQGDPFLLEAPPEFGADFRYYVFTTGEEPTDGWAYPIYASPDLASWQRIGSALATERLSSHWAPCVTYIAGLARPFVMLYSRAIGTGEQGHIGHTIRRADSAQPAGPYLDTSYVLTPGFDFAIDPDIYRRSNGSLAMAFAVDFIENEPFGTGIVEAPIASDLTRLTRPPRLLARPSHPWQIYDAARVMPWKTIPGIDWRTDTVRWHTIEAPVGGLVSPAGRSLYLYSGGCFFDFYAVGAIVENPPGVLRDVTDGAATFVIQPNPDAGFFAPGHCSLLRAGPDRPDDYLLLHARFGSAGAKRQMCLARLRWTDADLPIAEPAS